MERLTFISFIILCTTFSAVGETSVSNPAFTEVAPCPCDLTSGSCDIGCCCDGSCSDDQKSMFDCIPGLPGGQDPAYPEYDCKSSHFHKDDWFPLLCVVFEYNAFLGLYYAWEYIISTTQAFQSRLTSVNFFSYSETEERTNSDKDLYPVVGYRYGITVKTGRNNTSGMLVMPQPVSGLCLATAPVRYLEDIDTSCTYQVTQELCSATSILSKSFYVEANMDSFQVLEEHNGGTTAPTSVNYLCANATVTSTYLRNTAQTLDDIVQPDTKYTFGYTLPTDACMDSCGNDICTDYNGIPDPPSATLPGGCAADPPVPSFDISTGICSNAVLEVIYNLYWNAGKIVRMEADIVVGDVANTQELTQKYSVNFIHEFNITTSQVTDNYYNISGPYSRSGYPGYEFGRPMHSGSTAYNTSLVPPSFLYVNTNSTRQMSLFKTGPDGLCINAERGSINFGEDALSNCAVRLGRPELADCSQLRKEILNRLNYWMPSEVIGRRGYNDPINLAYWVSVLRENITDYCIESEYYPTGLSPVDNMTGICYNITDGIHLDVMYGESGRTNNNSIYEILGAKISYRQATWQLRCSGADQRGCTTDTHVETFLVSASVRFIKIPANTPEPVAIYYDTPEEDDRELCPQDRCWDNFMYPLTSRYTADPPEYVLAMTLLSIFFFIGYLLVTRPWW